MEPMPSIPALPPAAPSFAERLNLDAQRSLTATVGPRSLTFSTRDNDFAAYTHFHHDEQALAPPRLLTLRPPLRKKKSFTHVSNWLQKSDGTDTMGRQSCDSLDYASPWDSDAATTTWSPASSPAARQEQVFLPEQSTRAGEIGMGRGRSTVGVAV